MQDMSQKVGFPMALLAIALVASLWPTTQSAASTDKLEIERGRYLVEEVAKCPECHTPRNAQGELDRDAWLQGAPIWITSPGKGNRTRRRGSTAADAYLPHEACRCESDHRISEVIATTGALTNDDQELLCRSAVSRARARVGRRPCRPPGSKNPFPNFGTSRATR
jgi:hypothetical protein